MVSSFSFLFFFALATLSSALTIPVRSHSDSSPVLVDKSNFSPNYNGADTIAPPRRRAAKRCANRDNASSSSSSSSSQPQPTTAPGNVQEQPTVSVKSSTEPSDPKPTTPPTPTENGKGKPSNWPTRTQSGATYSATRATSSDPYLEGVSYALNNKNNDLYTKTHTGDLTYYAQGMTACGDYYDDSSYTAAISHSLFDAWPGATAETNRNPICGPYVPGRSVLNMAGTFTSKVSSAIGNVLIGGDGLPNCASAVGGSGQCHIPLTATITNPSNGKSVVVKIVDRCAGCEGPEDIDVTPTVFSALADKDLGRVSGITWKFNQY